MALRGSGRSRDDPLELDDPEDSAEKSLRGAIRPSTQQSIRRAIGLIVDLTGDSDEEHAQPPPLPNASKAENAIPVTALSVLPILQSHLVLDKAPVSHRPSNRPAAESNVGERRPYDALQSLFGTADDSTPMDQETASPQHVPKVSSPTGSRPPQPHSPKPKSPKAHPNSQHPSTKTASVPPPEPIAHRPQQELLVQCSTTPKGSPSPPMHRKSMAVKSASNWPRRDPRPIKRLLSGLSQRESSRLGLPPQSGQTSRAEPTLQTQSASLVQPTLEVPSISQVELTQPNASETIESMIPLSTDNLQTAMALVNACLQRHLRGTYTDHAYRVKSVLRAQRFRLERKTSPIGNISGTLPSATPQSFMQKESPFKSLKPLNKAVGSKDKIYLTQELFPKARTKDNKVGATVTSYRSTAVKVPRYDEYVALNQNVLMENRNTLPCYPWLPDDVDVHDMEIDLPEIFKMKNPKSNDLAYTRRFYQSGLKSFLAELDIEWQDVLYWHLAPEEELKRINKKSPSPDSGDFEKFLLQRKPFWDPNFKLGQAKWTALLSAISQPSTAKLRLAALASVAFHGQTPFKLWYLARQSPFAQEILSQNHSGAIIGTNFTYESAVCRVCQMHNCPHHGELRQYSRDHPWEGEHQARLEGYEDGSSDSDSEKIINYRRVANTHALPIYSGPVSSNGRIPTPPPDQFNAKWWKEHPVSAAKWWEKHSLAADWKRRLPFFPCKHEGTCEQAQCRCYRTETPCEKTCACAASCTRRFRGCSCAIEGKDNPGKLPLCQTSQCPCWRMNRECDADLCGPCGATEILDPVNRRNEEISHGRCCNVAIQRGIPKKTLIGHSEVHGFGLYIGEDVKQHEFICEYRGELLNRIETEQRRGKIYEKQDVNYMFQLNMGQDLDADHFGNKTRFINNADPGNLSHRNMLCNTVHRIGFYASTDLAAGTELFFNYGYPTEKTAKFKRPKLKHSEERKKLSSGNSAVKLKASKLSIQTTATNSKSASKAIKSAPTHNSLRPKRVHHSGADSFGVAKVSSELQASVSSQFESRRTVHSKRSEFIPDEEGEGYDSVVPDSEEEDDNDTNAEERGNSRGQDRRILVASRTITISERQNGQAGPSQPSRGQPAGQLVAPSRKRMRPLVEDDDE